ncbi:MAG: hypothetical protein ABS81_16145 [Pseudonocardia sp. SCN 72-86]|nr:MAG: hypothetical protein ABS81_16145 [Pseudonocardia sp. SCN 72-86]
MPAGTVRCRIVVAATSFTARPEPRIACIAIAAAAAEIADDEHEGEGDVVDTVGGDHRAEHHHHDPHERRPPGIRLITAGA